MKKLLCFVLSLSLIFLFGCSRKAENPKPSDRYETTSSSPHYETYQNGGVVLPKVTVAPDIFDTRLTPLTFDHFTVEDSVGELYYGYQSTYSNDNVDYEFLFVNPETKDRIQIKTPESLRNWLVGSGSTVIFQDRYLYEWKCYSEVPEESYYDVKLTRTDSLTGVVEVIDEINHGTPLIYMCKISDTEFLSYSNTRVPSDKTEYAVISSAWLYDVEGKKTEIISEKYENDASWSDSQGILIEHFAVQNGEIFGLGRRLISGNYQFFLYHYDKNGHLTKEEALNGFEKIIGSEQPFEVFLAGDYIIFRTYESQATFICKKTGNDVELIMKSDSGQVQYAVTDRYVYFIESNVNPDTDETQDKDCPLHIIDIEKDKIFASKFSVPLKIPYFVGLQSLSDNSLVFSYCENGAYDPVNIRQYLLDEAVVADELSRF